MAAGERGLEEGEEGYPMEIHTSFRRSVSKADVSPLGGDCDHLVGINLTIFVVNEVQPISH